MRSVPPLMVAGLLALLTAPLPVPAQTDIQVGANQPRSFIEPASGLRFVRVPAGSFTMGSTFAQTQPAADQQWFIDEAPPHRVTLSREFWLASTETTIAAFSRFVDETGYVTSAERSGQSLGVYAVSTDAQGVQSGQWAVGANLTWRSPGWTATDQHPVVHISWADAQAFVQWLRDKTGRPFRLPTEAEWEYAAGGSQHTRYSWGEQQPSSAREGNIADLSFSNAYPLWKYPVFKTVNDHYVHTAPVGSFVANDFGLFDMTGNVWEWCADRYAADTYVSGPELDPQGAATGSERVHRGGGFDWELPYLRVAKRRHGSEQQSAANIGFRVAL
ncbi:SUMF1/EgtB/PvdO family nonheme iron enzyme [Pseudomonas sp. SDI]|uniref:formylglycine-generating enzyme family protein n=1 Tax=Pseudomonas sp. SDI TaxID=2170734 RepID=UPI001401FE74|nr:SUMF1/EgtB/PvdO family nonheme iron enzyme [Pseudomonas sp. SDI]